MEYEQLLKMQISNILKSQIQPLNFYEIVSMAEGAFPTEVLRVLNESDDLKEKFYFEQNFSEQNILVEKKQNAFLSDPHPLDYDWRFSKDSVERILKHLTGRFSFTDTIALLGIKTLFEPLKSKFLKVALFNKSNTLSEEITDIEHPHEIIIHDLGLPYNKESEAYSVVFADPPWYPEYYEAFITRSTALLKSAGYLYLVLLPRLTRPFAERDREQVLNFCLSAGYDLIEENMIEVKYDTPKFEMRSLLLSGLYCEDWRKGDLFLFQKNRSSQIPLDGVVDLKEEEWEELRLGSKKVKFLKNVDSALLFGFNWADPTGPYLTQVSRRAEFREKINYWTSDNLALNVARLSVLKEALKELSLGKSMTDTILHCQNMFLLTKEEIESLLVAINLTINEG